MLDTLRAFEKSIELPSCCSECRHSSLDILDVDEDVVCEMGRDDKDRDAGILEDLGELSHDACRSRRESQRSADSLEKEQPADGQPGRSLLSLTNHREI